MKRLLCITILTLLSGCAGYGLRTGYTDAGYETSAFSKVKLICSDKIITKKACIDAYGEIGRDKKVMIEFNMR